MKILQLDLTWQPAHLKNSCSVSGSVCATSRSGRGGPRCALSRRFFRLALGTLSANGNGKGSHSHMGCGALLREALRKGLENGPVRRVHRFINIIYAIGSLCPAAAHLNATENPNLLRQSIRFVSLHSTRQFLCTVFKHAVGLTSALEFRLKIEL